MKALWVTNMWPDERRPWHGSFVVSQARSLERLGVDIDVLYMPGYADRTEYFKGIPALQKTLRSGRYDVIHAHYGHSAVVARMQRKCPLVISYCGDDLLGTPAHRDYSRFTAISRVAAWGFAQLAHTATRTITKSQAMERRLPRSCRARNRVIPNGVDLSYFVPLDRDDARRQLGWSDGRPNVLFVGNPQIARKNLRLARDVCRELARRDQPVELRIAWDIAPDQVPIWMNAADLLLFPSISEGSPNTIKEAMAVELPIVSAPVGDVPERLAGVAGTFIVEREVGSMADAVIAAAQVGRAPEARQAVEQLSAERVAEQVLSVYREAAG